MICRSLHTTILVSVLALGLAVGLVSCDSVEPQEIDSFVVEAFMNVGQRPSAVILRTTVPLDFGAGAAEGAVASGADVGLMVNGDAIRYREIEPGRYVPPEEYGRVLEAFDTFELDVEWEGVSATASGEIPPAIRMDSMTVSAPSMPVEAILVDSLRLDTLGVDARTGFIFPVETTVWWTAGAELDPGAWLQTRLRPRLEFSSVVVDFFLLPEEVFREEDIAAAPGTAVSWTGLYAVPVEDGDSPLPAHDLRIALVRSNKIYVDFATGRSDAAGREPPSNVDGGLGIAVGLSVDSVIVQIEPTTIGRKSFVFGR